MEVHVRQRTIRRQDARRRRLHGHPDRGSIDRTVPRSPGLLAARMLRRSRSHRQCEIRLGRHPGRQMAYEHPSRRQRQSYARWFQVGNRLYGVLWISGYGQPSMSAVTHFLDSFQLLEEPSAEVTLVQELEGTTKDQASTKRNWEDTPFALPKHGLRDVRRTSLSVERCRFLFSTDEDVRRTKRRAVAHSDGQQCLHSVSHLTTEGSPHRWNTCSSGRRAAVRSHRPRNPPTAGNPLFR
jgi:hypothetical protein